MRYFWLISAFLVLPYLNAADCSVRGICLEDESCLVAFMNSSGGSYNAHVQDCRIGTYAWKVCCKHQGQACVSLTFANETGGNDNAHISTTGLKNHVCAGDCTIESNCARGTECIIKFQNSTGGRENAHVAPCSSDYRWSLCCTNMQANSTEGAVSKRHMAVCGNGICEENESCSQDCRQTETIENSTAKPKQRESPLKLNDSKITQTMAEKESNAWIYYSAVLLGLAVFIIYLFMAKNPINRLALHHDVTMPSPYVNKVTSFMNNSFNHGYPAETVTKELKKYGWKQTQIDDARQRWMILERYKELSRKSGMSQARQRLMREYAPSKVRQALSHYTVKEIESPSVRKRSAHLEEIAKKFENQRDLRSLKAFIKECYRKGYPRKFVEDLLKSKGWKEEDITEAFESV